MLPRLLVLLVSIPSVAQATELLSLEWDNRVMADVGHHPRLGTQCRTNNAPNRRNNAPVEIEEFHNGLGCGQTVSTNSSVAGVSDFRMSTVSSVDNFSGSAGTEARSELSTQFIQDRFDSWYLAHRARLSSGNTARKWLQQRAS